MNIETNFSKKCILSNDKNPISHRVFLSNQFKISLFSEKNIIKWFQCFQLLLKIYYTVMALLPNKHMAKCRPYHFQKQNKFACKTV